MHTPSPPRGSPVPGVIPEPVRVVDVGCEAPAETGADQER